MSVEVANDSEGNPTRREGNMETRSRKSISTHFDTQQESIAEGTHIIAESIHGIAESNDGITESTHFSIQTGSISESIPRVTGSTPYNGVDMMGHDRDFRSDRVDKVMDNEL
ncbi:hypothetical protein DFP73DRAFT_601218 [Morchella snyderi]|nr:hypothetical protein DFP73DRAFT_601218 [Morchella snyderi]